MRWVNTILITPALLKDAEAFEETLLDAAPTDANPDTVSVVRFRVLPADTLTMQLKEPLIRLFVEGEAQR